MYKLSIEYNKEKNILQSRKIEIEKKEIYSKISMKCNF